MDASEASALLLELQSILDVVSVSRFLPRDQLLTPAKRSKAGSVDNGSASTIDTSRTRIH